MVIWGNKIINKPLSQLKSRKKYNKQLYNFLRQYKNKQKLIADILEENVKEG